MKITVHVTVNTEMGGASWRDYTVEAANAEAAHEHVLELVAAALSVPGIEDGATRGNIARAYPGDGLPRSDAEHMHQIERYGRHPDESSPSYRQSMRDAGRGGLLP